MNIRKKRSTKSNPSKIPKYGGWTRRFKIAIENETDENTAKKVMKDSIKFDSTLNYPEKAEWIRGAVERLENLTGIETSKKIMEACGLKCCGQTSRKKAKQLMSESNSLKEFIDKLNKTGTGGGRLKLKNKNTITGGYDTCYCGRVKHTREPFKTDTYCHCSTGWYKQLFQTALEKPVEVELLQSIITGAERCEFVIHIQ